MRPQGGTTVFKKMDVGAQDFAAFNNCLRNRGRGGSMVSAENWPSRVMSLNPGRAASELWQFIFTSLRLCL